MCIILQLVEAYAANRWLIYEQMLRSTMATTLFNLLDVPFGCMRNTDGGATKVCGIPHMLQVPTCSKHNSHCTHSNGAYVNTNVAYYDYLSQAARSPEILSFREENKKQFRAAKRIAETAREALRKRWPILIRSD